MMGLSIVLFTVFPETTTTNYANFTTVPLRHAYLKNNRLSLGIVRIFVNAIKVLTSRVTNTIVVVY